MSELILRNRQRARSVNLPLLRRVALALLAELFGPENHELGVYLVAAPEMMRLNERYLNHQGSTDVIAFDYSEKARRASRRSAGGSSGRPDARLALRGEIFICLDEAVAQARRFRATWQSELVRYLVHGVLHLRGYNDSKPAARRVMKRQETRLLRRLAGGFPLQQLAKSRSSAHRAALESGVAKRKLPPRFPLSKPVRKPKVRP